MLLLLLLKELLLLIPQKLQPQNNKYAIIIEKGYEITRIPFLFLPHIYNK